MIQGLNPGRIGTSEAGKRIWDAGARYQQKIDDLRFERELSIQQKRAELEVLWASEEKLNREIELAKRGVGGAGQIVDAFCRDRGVTLGELRGERRSKPLVLLRHEAIYLCAVGTELTLHQLGNVFNRDHTSILNAIRKHAKRNGLPMPRHMKDVRLPRLGVAA